MKFLGRQFETEYFIVLKLCHQINSCTAHLHAKFYDDIFLQYSVINFHEYIQTTRRKTIHFFETYIYRKFFCWLLCKLSYPEVLNAFLWIPFICSLVCIIAIQLR